MSSNGHVSAGTVSDDDDNNDDDDAPSAAIGRCDPLATGRQVKGGQLDRSSRAISRPRGN